MPNEPLQKELQPKINAKRSVRTLVYVLILGAAGLCVRWYIQNRNDPTGSFGTVDSVGMISAIKFLDEGQQVVAFDAKGKEIDPTGYRKGAVERDIAWQPDGNRVFFVSDRVGPGYQVYRWKPADGSEPEVRTIGSLGKSVPSFPAETLPHGSDSLLMVSGGFVLELNPKDTSSLQILPPRVGEVPTEQGDDGGGQAGQFSLMYSQLGDSFRAAKWCFGKQAVVAVMRRDHGETLLVQVLPQGGERPSRPTVLAMAEHIDFDVSPIDGSIVYVASGTIVGPEEQKALVVARKQRPKFQIPKHVIGYFKEGDTQSHYIERSYDDKVSFTSPRISPDGERVVLAAGQFDSSSSSVTPSALLSYPFTEAPPLQADGSEPPSDGVQRQAILVNGPAYTPSWSPTGKEITFIKPTPGGKRAIFVINFDGTGERNVSGEAGDFATPVFSPQASEPKKP